MKVLGMGLDTETTQLPEHTQFNLLVPPFAITHIRWPHEMPPRHPTAIGIAGTGMRGSVRWSDGDLH